MSDGVWGRDCRDQEPGFPHLLGMRVYGRGPWSGCVGAVCDGGVKAKICGGEGGEDGDPSPSLCSCSPHNPDLWKRSHPYNPLSSTGPQSLGKADPIPLSLFSSTTGLRYPIPVASGLHQNSRSMERLIPPLWPVLDTGGLPEPILVVSIPSKTRILGMAEPIPVASGLPCPPSVLF